MRSWWSRRVLPPGPKPEQDRYPTGWTGVQWGLGLGLGVPLAAFDLRLHGLLNEVRSGLAVTQGWTDPRKRPGRETRDHLLNEVLALPAHAGSRIGFCDR